MSLPVTGSKHGRGGRWNWINYSCGGGGGGGGEEKKEEKKEREAVGLLRSFKRKNMFFTA
jgi:hypothetical protein